MFVDSATAAQAAAVDPDFAARVTALLERIERELMDAAIADTAFATEAAQHIISAGG